MWEMLALKMIVLFVAMLLAVAEDVSPWCQYPLRMALSLWSLADAALQIETDSQRGEYVAFLRRI